jgi:dynein heavy chain, axonemal
MASLQDFESNKIEEWGRDVEASSQAKLKLPLLLRDAEKQLLGVNFDPALVKLLREVKYFLLLGLTVPDSALHIYAQVETFRRWTGNLDLIVNMNNDVLLQLLPVEKPLVRPYLDKFDRVVSQGVAQLCWKTDGSAIDDFINQSMEQVKQVFEVMRTMKTSLCEVQGVLRGWDAPLMERKPKPVDRDEFERSHKNYKATRYTAIKEGSKEIHNMLKEVNKVLKCSNTSPDWRAYVDFVNNVVVDGLSKCVCSSLNYLLDQIDPDCMRKAGLLPMLEIRMELVDTDVVFSPEVGFQHSTNSSDGSTTTSTTSSSKGGKGVRDLAHGWVGSFLQVAALFKRLDNEGNYLREMQVDMHVQSLVAQLNDTLQENQNAVEALRSSYDKHAYLWRTPMEAYFAAFCEDAVVISPLGQKLTDTKKYEEAIRKYEGVQAAVKKLGSPQDVGWLRVNVNPMKQALLTWSAKWSHMFTAYLQRTLVDKLAGLDRFMLHISSGLDADVAEGAAGKQNLMRVMKDIADVRKAMETTAEMFEPLRATVVLLKQHGVDVTGVLIGDSSPKEVQDYLEEAPMAWDALIKKTFRKKEEILPMQMAEVDSLKVDLELFFVSMREFRGAFRAEAPFAFTGPIEEAYLRMEQHAVKLVEKEAQVCYIATILLLLLLYRYYDTIIYCLVLLLLILLFYYCYY